MRARSRRVLSRRRGHWWSDNVALTLAAPPPPSCISPLVLLADAPTERSTRDLAARSTLCSAEYAPPVTGARPRAWPLAHSHAAARFLTSSVARLASRSPTARRRSGRALARGARQEIDSRKPSSSSDRLLLSRSVRAPFVARLTTAVRRGLSPRNAHDPPTPPFARSLSLSLSLFINLSLSLSLSRREGRAGSPVHQRR